MSSPLGRRCINIINVCVYWIARALTPQKVKCVCPDKHDTFTQCRFNVGQASPTLAQHESDIG